MGCLIQSFLIKACYSPSCFGHTSFELNYGYYAQISYRDDVDFCSKSKSADDLSAKLRELVIVCRNNLYHAYKLQKRAYNKGVKPKSYAASNKVWLNSKYIKTKKNQELKAKFLESFRVLHLVSRQAYQLKLLRRLFSTYYCWSSTPL